MYKKNKSFDLPDTKYYVYLPINGKYGTNPDFEHNCIFNCLDYAYGIGAFRLTSNKGFSIEFNPDKYSESDIINVGYFEAFDFLTHNILTKKELDIWKFYIRNEDMY